MSSRTASIDSLGAIMGAMAMIAYAVVVARLVTELGVIATLAIALVVWAGAALALYALAARVLRPQPAPS